MPTPRKIQFFPPAITPTLNELAQWTGATLADPTRGDERIGDVAAIDAAGPGDLTFLDNPRYLPQLKTTRAAAVFAQTRHRGDIPPACAALITAQPYRAMAEAMARLYPSAVAAEFRFRRARRLRGGACPSDRRGSSRASSSIPAR